MFQIRNLSKPLIAVTCLAAGFSLGALALNLYQRRKQILGRIEDDDDDEEENNHSSSTSSRSSSRSNVSSHTTSQVQRKSVTQEGNDDDPQVRKAKEHLLRIVEGSFTGAMIYVFDKLRLYDMLYEQGPSTAAEIAKRTGWSERWLVEIFAQGAAAGILEYHFEDNFKLVDGHKKFSLRREYADLLRDTDQSQTSLVGWFQVVHHLLYRVEATCNAVQTGVGVDYDYGSDLILALDRKNRNFFLHCMIPDIIEKVVVPQTGEKLVDMLDRGVNVADVGCGCGTSTITLAKRFPNSQFFAYEASMQSIQVLQDRIDYEGIINITVCDVADRKVGDGPQLPTESAEDDVSYSSTSAHNQNFFSFVYAHDVLHDMTNPRALISDVRKRLSKEEGCWVIVDVPCDEHLSNNVNVHKTPLSPINFGFSCLLCLSSATSEHGGEGLGTMGFPATMARRWIYNAGFKYFQQITIDSLPDNSCFVVA